MSTVEERLRHLRINSLWRCYNRSIYTVVDICIDTATNGAVVYYKLANTAEPPRVERFTRSVSEFLGSVKVDGVYVARFEPDTGK